MSFDGVAIIGAVEVPYLRRSPDRTTLGLLTTAFREALADAGIDHGEVDGLAVSSFTLEPDHAVDVAWQLGLSLRWCMGDSHGGAGGLNMLQHAARLSCRPIISRPATSSSWSRPTTGRRAII
jgi:3-oxoacyl-[acyl-carrier-protein] synthase III